MLRTREPHCGSRCRDGIRECTTDRRHMAERARGPWSVPPPRTSKVMPGSIGWTELVRNFRALYRIVARHQCWGGWCHLECRQAANATEACALTLTCIQEWQYDWCRCTHTPIVISHTKSSIHKHCTVRFPSLHFTLTITNCLAHSAPIARINGRYALQCRISRFRCASTLRWCHSRKSQLCWKLETLWMDGMWYNSAPKTPVLRSL
jgi:hypothetical protein